MQAVQDPVIPIVGEWTRDNPGTISLGQGVVSWGPPPEVYEALGKFREDPSNQKYKLVQGIPELLDAIEQKLARDNSIVVDALQQVVVTAGANMGFMNAILAITDPGDEVILPAPYYFNHEMAIRIAGCQPRLVKTDSNNQLDLEALSNAINSRTRAIVTISPNNPTGAVYPETDLRAVNLLCRDQGLYHISDEAYEYFTYESAQHFSPGSIEGADGHTISLFSLSKSYGFASWRIGYMIIPPHLLVPVKKIQDTNLICPPVISQYAATAALKAGPESFAKELVSLAEVRTESLDRLAQLGKKARCHQRMGRFTSYLKFQVEVHQWNLYVSLSKSTRLLSCPATPLV